MSNYVKDVLIKESTPQGMDKVFIVNNLPEEMLYTKQAKQVIKKDKDGNYVDAFEADPSGAQEKVLLDGLEQHKHDGAICFPVKREHVRKALENIDRYIDRMFPRNENPPKRVPYPERPGDMRSRPKQRHQIPVVNIPLPEDFKATPQDSPLADKQAMPVGVVPELDIEAIKKQAVEEYKEQKRAAMAKARESKKSK